LRRPPWNGAGADATEAVGVGDAGAAGKEPPPAIGENDLGQQAKSPEDDKVSQDQ